MARNALLVEISESDEAYAKQQDRFNCAVVRAVQRQLPNALYVTADTKGICFSIPEDGKAGVRYTFDPPPKELLESFDLHKIIPEEYRSFSVVARESKPMVHPKPRGQKGAKARETERRYRARTKSPQTHKTNRFLDAEAQE